jgi:hypothetical protein
MKLAGLKRRIAKLEHGHPIDESYLDVLAIEAANLTYAEFDLLGEAQELAKCHTQEELATILGSEKWAIVEDVCQKVDRELQKLKGQYKVCRARRRNPASWVRRNIVPWTEYMKLLGLSTFTNLP